MNTRDGREIGFERGFGCFIFFAPLVIAALQTVFLVWTAVQQGHCSFYIFTVGGVLATGSKG